MKVFWLLQIRQFNRASGGQRTIRSDVESRGLVDEWLHNASKANSKSRPLIRSPAQRTNKLHDFLLKLRRPIRSISRV